MSAQGFAERLVAALDRKGRSYTNVQFARDLTAALKGTGRTVANSTVTEWLKGRSEPPLYVIEAIGTVLSVTPAWLAFGEPGAPPARRPVIDPSDTRPRDEFGAILISPDEVVPAERPAAPGETTRKRRGTAG